MTTQCKGKATYRISNSEEDYEEDDYHEESQEEDDRGSTQVVLKINIKDFENEVLALTPLSSSC